MTTKVAVSMLSFLRTGEFGPINLGFSRRQLRTCLGKPGNWGPTPKAQHNASIWKYGDIEFHLDKSDTLSAVFSDHVTTLDGGAAIDLDAWIFDRNLSISDALEGLQTASIPYERIEWLVDDDTERYKAGVGVELIFLNKVFLGFSYSAR